MKRLDSFLVLGVPALLVMIALIVWKARSANDASSPSLISRDVAQAVRHPTVVRYRPLTAADLRRVRPSPFKTYYAYGEPLPPDYKCAGVGGPVYRILDKAGVSVIDTLTVAGVMVRCGGDERSSYR
jgi:hypothetical protein